MSLEFFILGFIAGVAYERLVKPALRFRKKYGEELT